MTNLYDKMEKFLIFARALRKAELVRYRVRKYKKTDKYKIVRHRTYEKMKFKKWAENNEVTL